MGKSLQSKIIILLTLLLFTSCLTIEADLSINENESGTARFVYSVSTLAVDISNIDKEGNVLHFPLLKNDFETAATNSDGIQIVSNNESTDGSRYFRDSEITFDSLSSLSLFTGSEVTMENSGTNKLLTVVVYQFPENHTIAEESLNIVRENFSDDFVSFTITIPGNIVRVEGATFSGPEVFFSMTVNELLNSTGNIQFSVEYR